MCSNAREDVRGYSPLQRALGRTPDLEGRASAQPTSTEHDGLLPRKLLVEQFCSLHRFSSRQDPRVQLCVGHVTSNAPRRDVVSRLHRRRADDLGSFFCPRPTDSSHKLFSHRTQTAPCRVTDSDSSSEQIGLRIQSKSLLSVPLLERCVQRTADVRHDGRVQGNGRRVRGLRSKSQLGYPVAQTTKTRGKLGPLPRQFRYRSNQQC